MCLTKKIRRYLLPLLRHAFCFGVLCSCPTYADILEQPTLREYEIKAGFVLNFLKFIRFPEPASQIVICTFADEAVQIDFARLEGQKVHEAVVRVVSNGDRSNQPKCQVLFIAKSAPTSASSILKSFDLNGVLTIGEVSDFNSSGGIIRFFSEESKIRFEVNLSQAERARIEIGSNMLRLAKIVRN